METVTEMTPTEPLKPCPFCGGPSRLYVSELAGVPELEPSYYVECADCGGCGPGYDDVFKSERYWNNACNNDPTRSKVAADDSPRRFDPVRGGIGRKEQEMNHTELLDELRDVQLIDNNVEDAERAWGQIEEIVRRFSAELQVASLHRKRANNLTRRVQELERQAEELAVALESILTWLESATEYPKAAELMLLAEYADGNEALTEWREAKSDGN